METIQFVKTGLYINQLVSQVDRITYYVGNDKREIPRNKKRDGSWVSTKDTIIKYENNLQLLKILDPDNNKKFLELFQFDKVFNISISNYGTYQQATCRELL